MAQKSKSQFWVELKERGIVYNSTSDSEMMNLMDNGYSMYVGFDLTSHSLHWGHYLLLLVINRAYEYGINTIILLGDITTQIGDASHRSIERNTLRIEEINSNLRGIQTQLKRLCPYSKIVLNSQFYSDISLLFLSSILSKFKLSSLLSKDFLKKRLVEESLTLKDIFYPVLQSYDFYSLFKVENVRIQFGGQDQWGNITTGLEFIRKYRLNSGVGGFTIPLLTDSRGLKFGKSGKKTLFLDEALTRPYDAYQYFVNLSDNKLRELGSFIFTLDRENSGLSSAKAALEYRDNVISELFSRVYTPEKYSKIRFISSILFSKKGKRLNSEWSRDELRIISEEIPCISGSDIPTISSLLIQLGFSFSHNDSKRLIEMEKCVWCFQYCFKSYREKLDIMLGKEGYFLLKKGEKEWGMFKLLV